MTVVRFHEACRDLQLSFSQCFAYAWNERFEFLQNYIDEIGKIMTVILTCRILFKNSVSSP